MTARASVLKARLNDTTAGDAVSSTPRDGSETAWTTKKYRWGMSPSGGAAPMKPCSLPSLRTWKALPGKAADAAPVSSELTSAGMSTSTQCQKPDGVGASGSKHVTT